MQAGFYNGLTFHRVVPGFMIQGGDPAGTGSGGPGFQWDDEYNPSAIFTGTGQLAMAKSEDDTNGSQFFITDSSPRYLDFNHTIFGQVIRGMDVVRAISNVTVNGTAPVTPVVISSASLIENATDAVVTLNSTTTAPSTANITVTVSDGHGGVGTRTFRATTAAESYVYQSKIWDDPPFLGPVQNQTTPVNTPLTITLTSTDIDSGSPEIQMAVTDNPVHATVQSNAPLFTITPEHDYTGVVHMIAGVWRPSAGKWDVQHFNIAVGDQPITTIVASNIAAVPGQAATIDVATFTDADPLGQAANYIASINWGDGHVSAGIISKNDSTFTVRGTNTYANRGRYPLTVTITGTAGATDTVRSMAYVEPAGASIQFDAGADALLNEGDSFARTISYSSTVAGDLSATADYGDGTGALKRYFCAAANWCSATHIPPGDNTP